MSWPNDGRVGLAGDTATTAIDAVSIEAGELFECFQWGDGDRASAVDELADVLTYCLLLADRLGVDADEIVLSKLEKTRQKYPVDKSRGRSDRYDRL